MYFILPINCFFSYFFNLHALRLTLKSLTLELIKKYEKKQLIGKMKYMARCLE